MQPFADKRRVSKVIINQIWVGADLPQLHETVETLYEAQSGSFVLSDACNKLIVEELLTSGELATEHFLSLLWELCLDLAFQSGVIEGCIYLEIYNFKKMCKFL